MKYLITLCLLISPALNAMDIDQAQSAPEPKPIKMLIHPFFGHVRADKNQRTIKGAWERCPGGFLCHNVDLNSYSCNDTQLTLTEIIPNDTTQQLTVYFSLKSKDKPAYLSVVIAAYGSDISLGISLGYTKPDVHYWLSIPMLDQRLKDLCDCPTTEHTNDFAAVIARIFAQPPVESNTKQLDVVTDSLAQLAITFNNQDNKEDDNSIKK